MYKTESQVVQYARRLGLCDGDDQAVQNKIDQMIKASAPITHPSGNRRFEDWVFLVKDHAATRVHLITCSVCEDRKRVTVYDVCEFCDGDGCNRCRNSGEVKNMIPCPECSTKK